jgi:hypothetical protein
MRAAFQLQAALLFQLPTFAKQQRTAAIVTANALNALPEIAGP